MSLVSRLFWIGLIVLALSAREVHAQRISLLRDAETEDFLHAISDEIFAAGGVRPEDVKIHIVDDTSLNAFYAGGQQIFVHTGLILETDDVNQMKGVIAHETGHMIGGHVQRMGEGIQPATSVSLLSLLLGAAAIAGGAPEAGVGIITGGQAAAQRTFLKFRRTQEAAADQAMATYLEEVCVSGKGFLEVFEKFRYQTIVAYGDRLDPYVLTHPLPSERVETMTGRLQESECFDAPIDPDHQARYERVKAKLQGYIWPARSTLGRYPSSDQSLEARYARIYAYNKALEWDKALAEADSLIAEAPEDPFFHEIKGQILLENGRVADSLPNLKRASELKPREPLILTLYGQALAAMETAQTDRQAVAVLERAVQLDPTNIFGWYQLAIVYTRIEQPGMADLAAAERYVRLRQPQKAAYHANRAVKELENGTPPWLRAQDIRLVASADIEDGGSRRR